ncbi:MAG: PIG-L family deacetylase [bacterium]
MNDAYPPLLDPTDLPSRVLCIAPHPDDEVIACGGQLAFHAQRGDRVCVLVLTDGGDAELRETECRAGLLELGVSEVIFAGFRDGALGEAAGLDQRLRAEIEDFEPSLVYAPSPFELHRDHRAAFRSVARVLQTREDLRCLFWGLNSPVPRDVLFDTTRYIECKRRALVAHASQNGGGLLVQKALALDAAATINVDDTRVLALEAFADKRGAQIAAWGARAANLVEVSSDFAGLPRTTAVLTSFNKCDDLRENLAAIFRQSLPFAAVVVVDNASKDGSQAMIEEEFPGVDLIVMPSPEYGACETFNLGFASARTPLIAILDDDIVMPEDWLEKATRRLVQEPDSTAIVSTKVVEPGMPESYKQSPAVNSERYMSTFRGCASLARAGALREAGFYDARLFIYGNERDLTCRLLNLGFRVLQFPGAEVFHKTPFGIKPGPRSLYFHARNAWLTMFKYAPAWDLVRLPFLVLKKVVLRDASSEASGTVSDAVGTIGIGASLRETPGALGIVVKAAFSVLWNLPYCLKHRQVVRHPDFELPLQ